MLRVLKTALKILKYTGLTVVLLLAVGAMLLQVPRVQTFLGQKALEKLSEKSFDADISFSELKLKPFNTLIIKNIVIIDKDPYTVDTTALNESQKKVFRELRYHPIDTLFAAENITATFTLRSLTGGSVKFNGVHVHGARMCLVLEDGVNTNNLTRIFSVPEKRFKQPVDKEVFYIKAASIEGMDFALKNYTMKCKEIDTLGVNWNDLDIKNIQLRGRNMRLRRKIMSGELDFLSFSERSGYSVVQMSGQAKAGQGTALIENLKLIDPWSDLDIPHLSMHYEHPWDFGNFTEKVSLQINIDPSTLNLMSLSYFAPSISRQDFALGLNGSVEGPVSALDIDALDFSSEDELIRGQLSGDIDGLTTTSDFTTDIKIKNLHFTTAGVQNLLSAFGAKESLDVKKYADGVDFTMDGSLNGTLNDMTFYMYLRSSNAGSVVTNLQISGLKDKKSKTGIAGDIRTTDLNVEKLVAEAPVGECTLDATMSAEFGGKEGGNLLSLDSLRIKRLNFNDYDYTNIAGTGTFSDKQFDGKIICSDPNLNFIFQGIVATSIKTNNAVYRFYANLGHADLFALNFDKRGRSEVRGQIDANFTRTGTGELLGRLGVKNLVLDNDEGTYDIGNITAESFAGEDRHRIRLNSDFLEGTFSGSAPITDFFADVVNVTGKRELPSLFKEPEFEWSGNNYQLSFRTANTSKILAFVAPGVYIADNTTIDIDLDENGLLEGEIKSQRLAYNEQYVKDTEISIDNKDGQILMNMEGESLSLASIVLKNNKIKAGADDDVMYLKLSYDNEDEVTVNNGELDVVGGVSRTEDDFVEFGLEVLPSTFFINSKQWDILPSKINFAHGDIDVSQFKVQSAKESISAAGGISKESADTLDIILSDFDLGAMSPLLGENFDLTGTLSGKATITSPGSPKGVTLDFVCDSTGIAGEEIGRLYVNCDWDKTFNRFNLGVRNNIGAGATSGEAETFAVNGHYYPSIKHLELMAKLDSFNLGYAAPFLESVFSEVGGTMSGEFMLSGPTNNMSISSRDAEFQNTKLKIGYTNVEYTVSGPFHADDLGIYFDDVRLTDRYGNEGRVGGKIGYDHFRNMNFDTEISIRQVEAVNIEESVDSDFYGHLFASGNVNITGPMSAITLAANVSTAGDGDFHVPLSSAMTAGSTDLLKFKQPEVEVEVDPYDEMMSKIQEEKTRSNEFAVNLNVSTTPQVEVYVEIDKESGNILKARGAGSIDVNVQPSKNIFDLSGDYTLSSGNYHLVLLGIAARDFTINDGSTIRFNGDILSSTLNIGATYRTKTSISTLISDTTATSTRRTVECGVQVTDRLSNPRLSFSINIPDLDPAVKARVESALSTEDKVQKQFLSLLISNSFIPDEQSGIVNNSTVLFSNVSEIMANQLNNIFQKLDIPLDLGLNYQQTDSGNDVFDVAVSTQLFNNRVTVNGNIGNRQYQSSSSGSEVEGDIDIEIKLTRPGTFKLTLFSHSADQYTNYLDDSQRNGVGISFQQEFNHFGKWFKRAFSTRKKRKEIDAEEAKRQSAEEVVEIKIE